MNIKIKIGSKEINPKELFEQIGMDNFKEALSKQDEIAKALKDFFDNEKDAAQYYDFYYRMSSEEKKYNIQIATEIMPVCLKNFGIIYENNKVYSTPNIPNSEYEINSIITKICSMGDLEKEQLAISCIKMSDYNDDYIKLLSQYYISSKRNHKDFIVLMSLILSFKFLKTIQNKY